MVIFSDWGIRADLVVAHRVTEYLLSFVCSLHACKHNLAGLPKTMFKSLRIIDGACRVAAVLQNTLSLVCSVSSLLITSIHNQRNEAQRLPLKPERSVRLADQLD
jgi:hypothetical protein